VTIFGFDLSHSIKCSLADRFEFVLMEQSPTQAVLLLQVPLMTVGNFTFACQGGYSTRVTVEVPHDVPSHTKQNSIFNVKEVRFNSSSLLIGLHSLLPFIVHDCHDCHAHFCMWSMYSRGSYTNISSGSVWSNELGSQACEVPKIDVFGFYLLQIYGNNFTSSSTDIYIIPFISASTKVLQNCKENEVVFELESSNLFDLDLQCRIGMQNVPTLVVQRNVRCMYGSNFAILNRTVSLSSRWGLIAANDTWNRCESLQRLLAYVDVLEISPTKATMGIPSKITLTIQTNAASASTTYACLWDSALQTPVFDFPKLHEATSVNDRTKWKTLEMTCETPSIMKPDEPFSNSKSMSIEIISIDENHIETVSVNGMRVMLETPAIVTNVEPSKAPAAAAVTVTVTGAGFRNTAALSCRVGRGASAGGDASTAAVAQ